MTRVRGLVFDIDNTVYHHPAYQAAGTAGEVAEVARILGQSVAAMETMIKARRRDLGVKRGSPATMTETVQSLGVTAQQWNELRCRVWQPEQWLTTDAAMCQFFRQLAATSRIVAFGTNSPATVGEGVLRSIGLRQMLPDAPVWGSDTLAASKPDPQFFRHLARQIGCDPAECLSIGDREFSEGPPAIAAGYAGAVIFPSGRDELLERGSCLLSGAWRQEVVDV